MAAARHNCRDRRIVSAPRRKSRSVRVTGTDAPAVRESAPSVRLGRGITSRTSNSSCSTERLATFRPHAQATPRSMPTKWWSIPTSVTLQCGMREGTAPSVYSRFPAAPVPVPRRLAYSDSRLEQVMDMARPDDGAPLRSLILAIRAPLFIQHGANDPRVPLSETEAIHRVLTEKGVRCDLIVYDDEGHTIAKLDNRVADTPPHLDRCWLTIEEKRDLRDLTIHGGVEAA